MSTTLLRIRRAWVGACAGFIFAAWLICRPVRRPPERIDDGPRLPHHRRLDAVTKQAMAEVFWLRADRHD